jgi:MATE family multidrug resistance protein
MSRLGPYRHHASAIARLSGPLLVNNLATAGMMAADTIMAGQLGAVDLAAVAIGANYFYLFYIAGLGLLMSLTPTIAQALGAGRESVIGGYFRQGLWLALAVAVPVMIGLALGRPLIALTGAEPAVVDLAARYAAALIAGAPAMMAFLALRMGSDGIGWTRPAMYTALIALVTNVIGNYVFMYGKFGLPALGAVGCGVATSLTQWLIFGVMLAYVRLHPRYRPFAPLARYAPPDRQRLKELLRLGLPFAGSLLAEASLFAVAALMLGSLGATVVAGHAIAINYAVLAFMVPMSFSAATTIHTGYLVGTGALIEARRAGWTGAVLCVAFMLSSAVVILFARDSIAALYTEDAAVAALAATLLLYAAVFQVADGTQVGIAGALRGFKEARIPFVICVGAYWLIGFPLAWYLGFGRGAGAPGVWIGLTVGLFAAAALLTGRWLGIAPARTALD